VFVVGRAEVSVPPDLGILDAELIVESGQKALETLRTQSTALLAEARRLGFKPEDIEGSEVGKSLRFSGQAKPAASIMSRKLSFRTSNLAAAVALFDRLGAAQHLENLSIRFEVSKSRELDAKLLVLAAEDARVRAKQLAKAVERQAGIALAISEEPLSEIDVRLGVSGRERLAALMAAPEPDKFASRVPATLRFAKQVYAKFKLE